MSQRKRIPVAELEGTASRRGLDCKSSIPSSNLGAASTFKPSEHAGLEPGHGGDRDDHDPLHGASAHASGMGNGRYYLVAARFQGPAGLTEPRWR